MDAIDTLMNEHRMIERVLDGLVGFSDASVRRGSADRAELGRFVEFFREFADGCHHGKEEDILFRAMVDHGFPSNGGPIAVMLHEHGQCRTLVGTLRLLAEREGEWTAESLRQLAETARGYAALLGAHIQKEDGILYPMAGQHLPPAALGEVDAACVRFEASRSGAHDRLHALGEALGAHAPADRSSLPKARLPCGHH
jgi:hemerythrin-like domain-containing protein